MKSNKRIEKFLRRIDVIPDAERKNLGLNALLENQYKTQKSTPVDAQPASGRFLLHRRQWKIAVVVVIIIAALPVKLFLDRGTTSAYALEQTAKANHTIKTIHLRMFRGAGSAKSTEFMDCWAKYDDTGWVTNFRRNFYGDVRDGDENLRFTVWNEGVLKTWMPLKNVVMNVRVDHEEDYWEHFARNYDPKLLFDRLYDLQENDAIELDIDEPKKGSGPIYVKAVNSEKKTRLELVVDSETKLVKQFSRFHLGDREDQLDFRIDYLAYNQPIDRSVFMLGGIPDDAKVIDRVDRLVGLEKNGLTHNEIAARVVQDSLKATIEKDYEEVSRLMVSKVGNTIEDFVTEEFGAKLVRVISIGRPEPHAVWPNVLCVPSEIEIENDQGAKWAVNITATAKTIGQPGNQWVTNTDFETSSQNRIVKGIIVPGERVGDIALGMSKDDVLKRLGKPKMIYWGGEQYTLNNLPVRYRMYFGHLSFEINYNEIREIIVPSSSYTLDNGLGVGDSEQKIKQTFGKDYYLDDWNLIYTEKGLQFSIVEDSRTVNEICITRARRRQTVMPGVGMGEFTLGMSQEEVLKRLGKPLFIYHGNVRYTLDNLPSEYRLYFGDIEFQIVNNAVVEIMAHSPLCAFDNGLTVGDSADKVKQIFGTDFEEDRNSFHYYNKGLRFEFDKEKRTVREIRVFRPGPKDDDEDDDESDAPDKADRKQSDRSKSEVDEGDFKAYMDAPGKQVCMNLCGKDLHALDLRFAADILDNLVFDHETLWPPAERLPEGFDPQILLEEGMNPGLGVRSLHAQGITGAGVHVGLIDQPVFLDHPEYAGKIISYHAPGFEPQRSTSHGTSMASMLVGERCGTAPGAKLHVVAVPSWEHDAGNYARALDSFVEYNQKVPSKDKIRIVSISGAPSGEGSNYNNQSQWEESVQRAEAQGILVLDGTWHHGFVSICWLDPKDRENVEACTPGFRNGPVEVDEGHIHVPATPRTMADDDRPSGYIYLGGFRRISRRSKAGYSDAIPYAAGIMALGWQINPDLTPAQIKDLIFASTYVHESGAKIINPPAFIELVRKQKGNSVSGGVCNEDSETQTIVPGVSIGEFTLGMSKDEVLKRLGKPQFIYRGSERYTLDNLPGEYRLYYGDIEFEIVDNAVREIMIHSPSYAFDNGLTVGDSADKVIQIFGTDFEGSGNVFCYSNKGLRFEFDEEERILNEIRIFEPEPTDIASQIQFQGAESVGAGETQIPVTGEILYNGIRLTVPWPPAYNRNPREPMPVPYIENPPDVIPIDVGRQLFVDDFLIQETTLKREFHRPEYHKANPIIKPDKPWENKSVGWFASPFSGGAWYDPADKLFKIWYQGGFLASTCYATSKDGIHWDKPILDVEKGTNIVLEPVKKGRIRVDTTTVWLDHDAKDPQAKYKYFATEAGGGLRMTYRISPDGIHWSGPVARHKINGDRTTAFYNPFRKVWVLSERISWGGRARAYSESPDPKKLITDMGKIRRVNWVAADHLDPHHTDEKYREIDPQLYNLDAVPYESLMLGMFSIWQGPNNGECRRNNLQKRNDILLGFSRDGFHFSRPDRKRFISTTWDEKNWRYGNVQSVNGGCYVVGDKLYFYFSGRAKPHSGIYDTDTIKAPKRDWDADAATGLAILRRDGFASMDTHAESGTLTTRVVSFKGKCLFVNVDCPKGGLKVEVLDKDGKVIEPFTLKNCEKISCDKTLVPVTWESGDLSTLAGKPIRFCFHLNNGKFYSFWVSPDKSGASYGYVGAGGPGFTGATDTVGIKAYI